MRIPASKPIAAVLAIFCGIILLTAAPVDAKALSRSSMFLSEIVHRGSSNSFSINNTDLVNLFNLETRKSDTLQDAFAIVQRLQSSSASSCNRRAASQLLTSCGSLEPSASDGTILELLDRIKDLYAIRLALCELESAGATIPACSDIIKLTLKDLEEDDQPSWSGMLNFGRKSSLQAKVLQPCLAALEKRPSAWVSYSNNRAQAVTMCQGIRDTLEKDQMLETYRNLVDVVSKSGDRASQIALDLLAAKQQISANQLVFREALAELSVDLYDMLDSIQERGQSIRDSTSDAFASLTRFRSGTEIINTNLENSIHFIQLLHNTSEGLHLQQMDWQAQVVSTTVNLVDDLGKARSQVLQLAASAEFLQNTFQSITGGWNLVAGYCFAGFCLILCTILTCILKPIRWYLFLATFATLGAGIFASRIEDGIRSCFAKCEETVRFTSAKCEEIIATVESWMESHYHLTLQVLRLTCVFLLVVVLAALGFVALRQVRFLAQQELDQRAKLTREEKKLKMETAEKEGKKKAAEYHRLHLDGFDCSMRLRNGSQNDGEKKSKLAQNARASSEPIRSKLPISTLFTRKFPEKNAAPKEVL